MSKESRKAARAARESRRAAGTSRPAGTGPGAAGSAGTAGTSAARRHRRPGTTGTGPATSATRRSGSTARTRAGRRERVRTYRQPSFFERYRTAIVSVVVVAVAAIGIGWIFLGSTAAAYTCGQQFNPSPTPTVEPGSSTRLGFLEDDMGRSHAVRCRRTTCTARRRPAPTSTPPASGRSSRASTSRTTRSGPPNWVHNLEHGGMVVLYRNDSPGATAAGQQAFTEFFNSFPASPLCRIPAGALSPVIARFDQMPHPYAALVWDRVLYMDTWDPDAGEPLLPRGVRATRRNGDLVAPPEERLAAPTPGSRPRRSASAPTPRAAAEPRRRRRPRRRRPLPARSRHRARADATRRRRDRRRAPATGIAHGSRRVGCATLRACAPS